MTDGPRPSVGLYWFASFDPTVAPGMSAPLNQLLIRTDDPSIYYKAGLADTDWVKIGVGSGGGGGGGGYALPEQWAINNLSAGVTATLVFSAVSVNFDDLRMLAAGSIVGMLWRWSDTITAGQATINITKNGAPVTLAGVSTNASNQDWGSSTQGAGTDTFVAGDQIGATVTTDGSFEPDGATNLELWILVQPS